AEGDGFDVCQSTPISTTTERLALNIELRCDFAGDGTTSDVLSIHDRAGRDRADAAWHDPIRLEDSTWVFDAGGDAQADLIIDFRPQGEQLVARLYLADGGEGVAYDVQDGDVTISPPAIPAVTVSALNSWWLDAEKV